MPAAIKVMRRKLSTSGLIGGCLSTVMRNHPKVSVEANLFSRKRITICGMRLVKYAKKNTKTVLFDG